MVRPRVFFDFTVDNTPAGRVIFELYNDSAPKTAENFRALCTGEKGLSLTSECPLYYKNSIIHRSINGFMIQGGDFTKRNGTGGESIYGAPFPDEDLSRPLDSEGLLCMANKGPNTNNSQFFVTLRDCPHLNGKHVVFGRVIRGYDVIQKISQVPTDEKDRPRTPVVIANSGELMLRSQAQAPKANPEPASASDSDSQDERRRFNKRRHPSRSRSSSPARATPRSPSRSRSRTPDSDRERERKRHKSLKKKEKKHKSKSKKPKKAREGSRSPARSQPSGGDKDPEPVSETESQYDARLEREENERIEAARKRELERVARRLKEEEERRARDSGGVRFKGRGRMKYLDPELQQRRD
ncbi:cyclophilin-like domain-containing protein [Daedaleopsis nitida]|nr:cyclophilin-like domain-containing protein [Daedaleopsis nitida]